MKKISKTILSILLALTVSIGLTNMVDVKAASEVNIPDVNLYNAIVKNLRLSADAVLTIEDMERLTSLSHYSNYTENDISSLEGLQYATNLNSIYMVNSNNNTKLIEGLDIISMLPELTSITLDNAGVDDLTFLQNNTTITVVSLSGNMVNDISVLASMPQLKTVKISGPKVNSISNDNGGSSGLSDLTPLANLTNITYLELVGHGDSLQDISPLAGLTKLIRLKLFANNISDISVVANFTELDTLDVRNNNIANLPDLSKLTKISWLSVHENPELTNTDVEKIGVLSSLTTLQLSTHRGWHEEKKITDISPLANLVNLTSLDVGGTSVSDVSPLSSLSKLRTLSLSGNLIEDPSPLAELTRLDDLSLDYNKISDTSTLMNIQPLTWLDISNNQLADISMLDVAGTNSFNAKNQTVTLKDIYLGDASNIKIAGVADVIPGFTWRTAGTYNDGQLLWKNLGANELSFSSTDGKFTGKINQNVVTAPVPASAALTVGDDITIFVGKSYDLMNAVNAVDYDDADLNSQVSYSIKNADGQTVSNDVTNLMAGTYTITYSVTGKTGDVVTATKILTILPMPVVNDIYEDETVLSGTALAGVNIEVTCPNGSVITTIADANGLWSIAIDGPIKESDIFTIVITDMNAGISQTMQQVIKPIVYKLYANDIVMSVKQLQTLRQNGTLEAYVLEQAGANATKTTRTTTAMPVRADVSSLVNVNNESVMQVTTYVAADATITTYDSANSLIEKPIIVTITDDNGSDIKILPNTGQNPVPLIVAGFSSMAVAGVILGTKKKKSNK